MGLGDRFVDGTDADWEGVGRAFAGSVISGIILAIISFIQGVRMTFMGILDGVRGWALEFIPAALVPTTLGDAWSSAGSEISSLGPLGFIISIILISISIWIGTTALIQISRRLLP